MSKIYEAIRRAEMATAMTRAAENSAASGGTAVALLEPEPQPLPVAPAVTAPPVNTPSVAARAPASPAVPTPAATAAAAIPAVTASAIEIASVANASAVNTRVVLPRAEGEERRTVRRSKLGVPARVRPSDPEQAEQFDEILKTQNTSKGGLYFTGTCQGYQEGMRLFITFPYYANNPSANSEYWAQVVRLDRLPGGRLGVAVQMLGSMNLV